VREPEWKRDKDKRRQYSKPPPKNRKITQNVMTAHVVLFLGRSIFLQEKRKTLERNILDNNSTVMTIHIPLSFLPATSLGPIDRLINGGRTNEKTIYQQKESKTRGEKKQLKKQFLVEKRGNETMDNLSLPVESVQAGKKDKDIL